MQTRAQILFIGCNNYGLLIHITAVAEHLIADVADVLERQRRSGRVEDQHEGGGLSQAAVAAPARLQIPLGQRILRELVDGREVGHVDVDDAVVGHQTALVAPRLQRRSVLSELIADELLIQ